MLIKKSRLLLRVVRYGVHKAVHQKSGRLFSYQGIGTGDVKAVETPFKQLEGNGNASGFQMIHILDGFVAERLNTANEGYGRRQAAVVRLAAGCGIFRYVVRSVIVA